MAELFNRLLRVGEGKRLKELQKIVDATAALAEEAAARSDEGLRERYAELRQLAMEIIPIQKKFSQPGGIV